MPSSEPITSITNWYRLVQTQYSLSTNHCCPIAILTQYTALLPRNAQLSQLDLVFMVSCLASV